MCEGVDIDRLQYDFQEAKDEIEDLKCQIIGKDSLISDYERQMDELRDDIRDKDEQIIRRQDMLDQIARIVN